MSLQEPCTKCTALWREYGDATRKHVELLREQEQYSGIDIEQFKALEAAIESAAQRRDRARAGIKLHLAADHTARRALTA